MNKAGEETMAEAKKNEDELRKTSSLAFNGMEEEGEGVKANQEEEKFPEQVLPQGGAKTAAPDWPVQDQKP